jgi:mannose-6-phosphate isomerase-like protein (cupin superfamily)
MTNNKEYTEFVELEEYPTNPIVPLDNPFINQSGIIQNLLNTPINGVAIITSVKGSIRSNHWHKKDFHFLYVLSGAMEYYERGIDEEFTGKPLIVKQGEMVFTPPRKVHKTVFLENTILVSMSKRNRDHTSHEEDVVRQEF